MLWAILAVAAVAGVWVLYRLLFLETAPVQQESGITYEKPLRTKKAKVEKVDKKKKDAAVKKDTHFDRKAKDSDEEEEDEKAKKPQSPASPSSPAKKTFAVEAVVTSKKAQNKDVRNGFQPVQRKARPTVTEEEKLQREAAKKEEEEERKKKDEARKLKQKERTEREEKEKEKLKATDTTLSEQATIKDILDKQRKEKELVKAARTGGKGGVVKVFSSPQGQDKKWEASIPAQAESSAEPDDESFPQLGSK
jgi:hypothetical protein